MIQEMCWVCKNFDDKVRLSNSKTVDSEAVFQAREANLVCST